MKVKKALILLFVSMLAFVPLPFLFDESFVMAGAYIAFALFVIAVACNRMDFTNKVGGE